MQAIISPGNIHGSITPPPSKSMMQRVCAAALLHNGKTTINNPGISDDDKAALHIIEQLGASITYLINGPLTVNSNGVNPNSNIIDCSESGLSARLFTPIASLSEKPVTINGSGSLLTRPMHIFEQTLPQLSVALKTNGGCLPLHVKGPLRPADMSLDGSVSSQFLSGLLFAFAFSAQKPVTIKVDNLVSKPYIDLSLHVLRKFGINLMHENYKKFFVEAYNNSSADRIVYIEADWSSAAVWLVAATIAGDVTINGLHLDSTQADRAVVKVLKLAGVSIKEQEHSIHVAKTEKLTAFNFDATHCPDLVPILCILAACCTGTSNIKGIHRLIHKESNRADSISAMLYHLGISFHIEGDTLSVQGADYFEPAEIDAYNDHRIVMAASIAALRAEGAVVIKNAEAVSKSYPDFFSDLSSLGAKCILKDE
ncbi:MAG: 3-phosphoshikimate 1-carboxyvinyltransferase [Bacteroidetes bacterium]|nr:3-phosphoshikimate 1-carboxyvinyltransferase [Bacteroidota bacterium]